MWPCIVGDVMQSHDLCFPFLLEYLCSCLFIVAKLQDLESYSEEKFGALWSANPNPLGMVIFLSYTNYCMIQIPTLTKTLHHRYRNQEGPGGLWPPQFITSSQLFNPVKPQISSSTFPTPMPYTMNYPCIQLSSK